MCRLRLGPRLRLRLRLRVEHRLGPRRRLRITQVLDGALDLLGHVRVEFLEQTCRDPAMRRHEAEAVGQG